MDAPGDYCFGGDLWNCPNPQRLFAANRPGFQVPVWSWPHKTRSTEHGKGTE